MQAKTLLVIVGPTGVGKTAFAIEVAQRLKTEIVNADSRQIYRELPIGTAAPTEIELRLVKHYFVANKSICDNYNAGMYEKESEQVISNLLKIHDTVILTGGGMMYIDAVLNGLDDIPKISTATRQLVVERYKEGGLQWLQQETARLDYEYYLQVDRQNPQRLIHAIEVSMEAGVPYSLLRQGKKKQNDYRVVKVGLYRKREELYDRIDRRVEQMMQLGLEAEAQAVYPFRELNSLNTVGYKEMFAYFDGKITKADMVKLIQQHSRNYAKRQMTWWKSPNRILPKNNFANIESDYQWLDANTAKADDILKLL